MAYAALDITFQNELVYRILATSYETIGDLFILWHSNSPDQPVAAIVTTNVSIAPTTVSVPPVDPNYELSDQTIWWVFGGGAGGSSSTPSGGARAYSLDATSQPGSFILATEPTPHSPTPGGQTVAIFQQSGTTCIFRAAFLVHPRVSDTTM